MNDTLKIIIVSIVIATTVVLLMYKTMLVVVFPVLTPPKIMRQYLREYCIKHKDTRRAGRRCVSYKIWDCDKGINGRAHCHRMVDVDRCFLEHAEQNEIDAPRSICQSGHSHP